MADLEKAICLGLEVGCIEFPKEPVEFSSGLWSPMITHWARNGTTNIEVFEALAECYADGVRQAGFDPFTSTTNIARGMLEFGGGVALKHLHVGTTNLYDDVKAYGNKKPLHGAGTDKGSISTLITEDTLTSSESANEVVNRLATLREREGYRVTPVGVFAFMDYGFGGTELLAHRTGLKVRTVTTASHIVSVLKNNDLIKETDYERTVAFLEANKGRFIPR